MTPPIANQKLALPSTRAAARPVRPEEGGLSGAIAVLGEFATAAGADRLDGLCTGRS